MLERNGVDHEDLVSIIFTATPDVVSLFPAAAARQLGLGDVPLLCACELDIVGATPRCLRVLMHISTTRTRSELHHVYMEGARELRDDLPE
jgi:chorismate mutase